MTNEEAGIYIKLLAFQWDNGPMTEDQVCSLIGAKRKINWRYKYKSLANKFVNKDGLIFNLRLEEERSEKMQVSETKRNSGKKGGRPKKHMLSEKEAKEKQKLSEKKPIYISNSYNSNVGIEKGGVGERDFASSDLVSKETEINQAFEEFLKVYGLRIGVAEAKRVYARALLDGIDAKKIKDAAAKHRTYDLRAKKTNRMNPANWLRERRWEDNPQTEQAEQRKNNFRRPKT